MAELIAARLSKTLDVMVDAGHLNFGGTWLAKAASRQRDEPAVGAKAEGVDKSSRDSKVGHAMEVEARVAERVASGQGASSSHSLSEVVGSSAAVPLPRCQFWCPLLICDYASISNCL